MQKYRTVFFALCCVLAGCEISHNIKACNVVLFENFNGDNSTGLAKKLLSNKHITLEKGSGPDGSDAIRVAYVGFEEGSERVVVLYPIEKKINEATLSFDVFFDKNFQWTHGGKLHGLGPEHIVSGSKTIEEPGGWSARVLFKEGGRAATYIYDQSINSIYGVGETTETHIFETNKWHHIDLIVKLNNRNLSDGYAKILVDNNEVIYQKNIKFRNEYGEETKIQRFIFSTFHGGSSSLYTPKNKYGKPTTVYAYFDNFMVIEGAPAVREKEKLGSITSENR